MTDEEKEFDRMLVVLLKVYPNPEQGRLLLESFKKGWSQRLKLWVAAQIEIYHLKKQVQYLRHYGNKDCTAMADQAMEEFALDENVEGFIDFEVFEALHAQE